MDFSITGTQLFGMSGKLFASAAFGIDERPQSLTKQLTQFLPH